MEAYSQRSGTGRHDHYLNRPDRLNSFNDLMHHQLAECLKQAERAMMACAVC